MAIHVEMVKLAERPELKDILLDRVLNTNNLYEFTQNYGFKNVSQILYQTLPYIAEVNHGSGHYAFTHANNRQILVWDCKTGEILGALQYKAPDQAITFIKAYDQTNVLAGKTLADFLGSTNREWRNKNIMNNFEFAKSIGFIDEKSMMDHSWQPISQNVYITACPDGKIIEWDSHNFNTRTFEGASTDYMRVILSKAPHEKDESISYYKNHMEELYHQVLLENDPVNDLAIRLGFTFRLGFDNNTITYHRSIEEYYPIVDHNLTICPNGKLVSWDTKNYQVKELQFENINELKEFLEKPNWSGLETIKLNNFLAICDGALDWRPKKYIALEENKLINFIKELGFADQNALMDHSVTIGTINWSKAGDGPYYGNDLERYNHYMTVNDTGNIVAWDNKDFRPASLQNSSPETIREYLDNQKSYLEKHPEDGVINPELDKDLVVFLGKVNEIHWAKSPHNPAFSVAMDARSEFFNLPAYDPKLLDFGDSKMIEIRNKLDLVTQYETNKSYALNLSHTAQQHGFIDLKDMFAHTLPHVAEIKTPEGIKLFGFSLSETTKEVCVWDLQSGSAIFAKPCASFDQARDFIKAYDHGNSLSEKILNGFCAPLEIKPAFSMER